LGGFFEVFGVLGGFGGVNFGADYDYLICLGALLINFLDFITGLFFG
jgi:hypothetical protein